MVVVLQLSIVGTGEHIVRAWGLRHLRRDTKGLESLVGVRRDTFAIGQLSHKVWRAVGRVLSSHSCSLSYSYCVCLGQLPHKAAGAFPIAWLCMHALTTFV